MAHNFDTPNPYDSIMAKQFLNAGTHTYVTLEEVNNKLDILIELLTPTVRKSTYILTGDVVTEEYRKLILGLK